MSVIKLSTLLLCTFMPSAVRLAAWRLLGFKVGRGCHVSVFSIVVADMIEIGHGSVIEALTMIYRPAVFSMGERSRIASFVRIVGHRGRVTLGPQTFVALGCLIDCTGDLVLGSRSQIGPRSTLYSHGATGLIFNRRYPHRIGPVQIGSDTWIGMGCIVHPQLTIGDRVIVLPGMVVRGNVPNDVAMMAPTVEHRLVSTSRLLLGVTDEVRMQKIEALFHQLSARSRGAVADQGEGEADVWRLALPGSKTLYLLRGESATVDAAKISTSESVVWTLFDRGVIQGVPSFCFDQLTVFGPWTPFAERIASFLCCDGGAHFVFHEGTSLDAGAQADPR